MPESESDLDRVIREIEDLPRTVEVECCGRKHTISSLQLYTTCPSCGKKSKLRAFGPIGAEIQDVIDAVLKWMGTGDDLKLALKRKEEIDRAGSREC